MFAGAGPHGVAGQLFFQNHGEKIGIPEITELHNEPWPGRASLLEVANPSGAGRSRADECDRVPHVELDQKVIDKPERMIFDLA